MKNQRILVLGANGFIGSHLVERLLTETRFTVVSVDRRIDVLAGLTHAFPGVANRLTVMEADLLDLSHAALQEMISAADVVVPLAAIARPDAYMNDPLNVFEATFQANLRVIAMCADLDTRVVFPSSSEVYGMGQDAAFCPDESHMVLGPLHQTRWLYANCKQLLERVLVAYGQQRSLRYTIFRPFNWIGARMDSGAMFGKRRLLPEIIDCLLTKRPVTLVGGGAQTRCFCSIHDGIDAIVAMIDGGNAITDGATTRPQVFNIGAPVNEMSIRTFVETVLRIAERYPALSCAEPPMRTRSGKEFYGQGYADIQRRVPDIQSAQRALGWAPHRTIESAISEGIEWALQRRGLAA